MPEQWEHELKKLRKVEQPSSLEDRVAEGPHPRREPGRPTRERVAAAVVAFAVCAAVGVFGYRTLSNDDTADGGSNVATGVPSGDNTLVLDLRSGADSPDATLSYGDETQDGVIEGYTWCPNGTGDNAECTGMSGDFASFPPVSEYLVVPPATQIEVTGDGTASSLDFQDVCDVSIPGGSCEPGTSVGELTPNEDGRYAIQLHATWPQGDATAWFGVQVLSSESAAPDMLTVDCISGVAQTDTSIVRTQPNGIAIQVVSDGSSDIEVRDERDQVSLRGASSNAGSGLAPGHYTVGCGRDPSSDSTVPFDLVDPDDNYASWDLACGDLPQTSFTSTVPSNHPDDLAISELLRGLAPDDRIRGAGYAADMWRLGPTYVVERDGESVVRVVLGEDGDTWSGTFQGCDGTGITLSDRIVTTGGGGSGPTGSGSSGSTGPAASGTTGAIDTFADTLVVRCEGLGPALAASSVRLQPDGLLDYEATNVADADWIVFEGEDPMTPPFGQPFDTVTVEGTIRTFEPGTYWVGCRVLEETGGFDGSHLDHPEAYVRFEVLPAEA
jgi:hypothetical protein